MYTGFSLQELALCSLFTARSLCLASPSILPSVRGAIVNVTFLRAGDGVGRYFLAGYVTTVRCSVAYDSDFECDVRESRKFRGCSFRRSLGQAKDLALWYRCSLDGEIISPVNSETVFVRNFRHFLCTKIYEPPCTPSSDLLQLGEAEDFFISKLPDIPDFTAQTFSEGFYYTARFLQPVGHLNIALIHF